MKAFYSDHFVLPLPEGDGRGIDTTVSIHLLTVQLAYAAWARRQANERIGSAEKSRA